MARLMLRADQYRRIEPLLAGKAGVNGNARPAPKATEPVAPRSSPKTAEPIAAHGVVRTAQAQLKGAPRGSAR